MAAFLATRWMDDNKASGGRVVIVEQPIMAGNAIKADQIRAVPWPDSAVPQDAYTRTRKVVGRIARVSMIPGEPVLPGKLARKGSKGGLSSIIPKGKRAITVRVNEVIAVAGFALPNSYVDVLLNGKDTRKRPFSQTVLSRVKVLAVDQITTGKPDKPIVVNAVTLELTPRESEKLDLARNVGKLSLVLRNEFDKKTRHSRGVRFHDIVNPPKRASAFSPDAKATRSVQRLKPEEIRGTRRKNVAKP